MMEKKNRRKTHHHCLLHANIKWEMVVAGSYSPCGLRMRRDQDNPDQNPIVVKFWGGTENEMSAFTHTWKLDILDTICVVTQKF